MSLEGGCFYEFGPFRMDTGERRLLRGDQAVPLTPKAYETLLVLVGSAGRALDKDELLHRIWPDTFVEEGSLTRMISALRATLGESEGPFIETIPKRGYRFVAPVKELPSPAAGPAAGKRSPTAVAVAAAVGLVLLAAGVVYFAERGTPGRALRSLAVLPLTSLAAGPDNGYIELGIADGIIAKLNEVPGLTVRPTTAIRKYMDATDPLKAARELRVDAVLEGTLQRAEGRLRVSLNLLPASGGASLWTRTFEVAFTDLFDVEDEVAQQVAAQFRLPAAGANQASQARTQTRNPEAYQHYLKGLYSFEMQNVSGASRPAIEAAISRFRKATELDPAYAGAYAQLAICYTELMNFYQPDGSMAADARQAAAHAYALAPDLPELHVFRAWMFWSWYGRYQVEEAIRELRGAGAQNSSAAYSLLGNIYSHAGLVPQALGAFRRAREIDPTSALHLERLAAVYVWAGRFDEAQATYRQVLALEPKERNVEVFSAMPFLYTGKFSEARRILEESRDRAPLNPVAPSYLALLDAMQGNFREAEAAIPDLAETSKLLLHGHHASYAFAGIYALQGKSAEAVRWLRRTAEGGMPDYPLFIRDPNLARIRNSPEFVEFISPLKARWEAMQSEFR